MLGLNCGSGQRPFHSTPAMTWINIDINPRWAPDVVSDWNDLSFIENSTLDYVVSHHSLEHVGCGEGAGFIREAYRVLRVGGSLLVFVPDMKALAQRWLLGQITTQIYMTNVYGAFMSDEADRHKWGYDLSSLHEALDKYSDGHARTAWSNIKRFDWRMIPGADIAQDWWILGMECVK